MESGMDPAKVDVPPYLPDAPEVRSDICDYYYQIQQFDQEVAEAVALLKARGDWENTVIIICGDNGWMMPRGLANCMILWTRVPLIISWPKQFPAGRVVVDFVSLNDVLLRFGTGSLEVPSQMTAQSLMNILISDKKVKLSQSEISSSLPENAMHWFAREDWAIQAGPSGQKTSLYPELHA